MSLFNVSFVLHFLFEDLGNHQMMIVIQRCYCLWLSSSPLPPVKLTQKNLFRRFHYSSPFSFHIMSRNTIVFNPLWTIILLLWAFMLANRSFPRGNKIIVTRNCPSLFFMRERATRGLYFIPTWSNAVPDNKTRLTMYIRNGQWWFARKIMYSKLSIAVLPERERSRRSFYFTAC